MAESGRSSEEEEEADLEAFCFSCFFFMLALSRFFCSRFAIPREKRRGREEEKEEREEVEEREVRGNNEEQMEARDRVEKEEEWKVDDA